MLIFEKKEGAAGKLPKVEGLPPILVELLMRRGAIDEASMRAFLTPSLSQLHDPLLLTDMQIAVECLRLAVEQKQKICIYGDYDVDGVCAVSMMKMCLEGMGADVCYYIPSRHGEGYGMNAEAVNALADAGVELIVSVDNGIRANTEAELCYARGMRLIVTDHHLCGETLPRAEAVLCHTRTDDVYPNTNLCGAGTAYKLIEALLGSDAALEYLPLAGLASVADVVPLLGENRAFAALALERINAGECQTGLRAIIKRARPDKKLGAQDIAYGVAPRLNAAGRLSDASLCVELLCSRDEAFCDQTADMLEKLNAQRQREETAICDEAFAILDAADLTQRRSIVLRGDWNSGVIGIAASRIAEKYYRPVMLFSQDDGMLTGSARSIPGVHLYAALLPCADLFARFGGHAAAAGASMAEENYGTFCERFENSVRAVAPMEAFLPRKFYELDAELKQIDVMLAANIEALAPFGEGNPPPLLHISNAYLRGLKRMGTDGAHLRGSLCDLETAKPCVFFGMGAQMNGLLEMDRCETLCEPAINRYLGNASLQLRLKAARPCQPSSAAHYIQARREKFIDAISRNILYNGSCSPCAAETVSADEWLADALRRDIAGVLVLCSTAEGALRLLEQEQLCAQMDICLFSEPKTSCAYHAAVLAPVLEEMSPWRYTDILLYDAPLSDAFAQKLQALAPKARIMQCGVGGGEEEKSALHFSRESFAPLYLAVRRAHRSFYNREELCDYLSRETQSPAYICRLAVSIMLELGFLQQNGALEFVQDAAKTPLENSETYRALQRICSAD